MKSILTEMMLVISNSIAASILFKVTVTSALTLVAARLARRSRASIRHVLVAASFALLFVLPIASVLAPPVHIPVPVTAREVVGAASISETLVEPLEARPQPSESEIEVSSISRLPRLSLTALLFGVWVLGIILFLGPVAAGMWQTRRLRRSSLPWRDGQPIVDKLANEAGIRRTVDVLLHESAPGPMTCGVLRPAIVLPVDAKSWPFDELSSAIIHELEHVRRGDWMTRCLARTVCAAYWFHPMVWALWRRFVLEAERACDDAVLRRSEATAYADQLVMLAQRLLASPEPPMLAMANRYDLARRVTALLDHRQRRGRAGVIWVGLTFITATLLVTAISPLHIVAGSQAGPKFEVASIKPCKEEDFASGQRRQEILVSPDRIVIQCRPLDRIIFFAYAGVGNMEHPLLNNHSSNPDLIRGGPGWIHTDTFVIEAKAEGISTREVMMGPMLRALLEERFQLKTRRVLEEAALYELTVAKGGLKLKAMKEGECVTGDSLNNLSPEERRNVLASGKSFVCGSFTAVGNGVNRTFSLGGETMTRFANQILSGVLDRYVVDKTEIPGEFNIHLEFGMDESIQQGVFGGRPPGPLQEPPAGVIRGPSIFTALEEQLGLKLEKTKGSREYLAIDTVQRPAGL